MRLSLKSKFLCLGLIISSVYAEEKIVQDNNGQFIEAKINNLGIIESLKGTISSYYPDDELKVICENQTVKIHKSMSGDGCYDIEMTYYDDFITITKIFTANKSNEKRDNLTYKIFFNSDKEFLVKDEFVTIRKENIKSSVHGTSSDSYLPLLKFEKNTGIQYFGKSMSDDDIGSRKYVYSKDMNSVDCYEIMPGDVWQKYMTATIYDFKSDNNAINLINYIILYNYDYQLGVMFFPILFDMNKNSSKFIDIEIMADSYLVEGKVKYLPENLNSTAKDTPWVEGTSGDGIGTKISIKARNPVTSLVISNGFDSLKKYIYENNNRVKKIKITNLEKKKNNFIVELPDTVDPYEIKLPFKTKLVEIEILSVYKGSKYEDTCLNYILAK